MESEGIRRQEPCHAALSGLNPHFMPCIRTPSAFYMTSYFTTTPLNLRPFQHHWTNILLCLVVRTGVWWGIESRTWCENLMGLSRSTVESSGCPGSLFDKTSLCQFSNYYQWLRHSATKIIKVKISYENLKVGNLEIKRKLDIVKIPNGKWVRWQKKYWKSDEMKFPSPCPLFHRKSSCVGERSWQESLSCSISHHGSSPTSCPLESHPQQQLPRTRPEALMEGTPQAMEVAGVFFRYEDRIIFKHGGQQCLPLGNIT